MRSVSEAAPFKALSGQLGCTVAYRQPRLLDHLFEIFRRVPIWVGPVVALLAFVLIRYVVPQAVPTPPAMGKLDAAELLRPAWTFAAWFSAVAVIAAWVAAEISKRRGAYLLDHESDASGIRGLSWQDFEHLVGEAYRRKGYSADVIGSETGDGGVDVVLRGHGQKILLQCKHWQARQVGVKIVRELLGVVVSENADKGIVVTYGYFTHGARAFAQKNPRIELVDRTGVDELIQTVNGVAGVQQDQRPASMAGPAPPACPSCGSKMIPRTARKGQNAGSQFWGCAKYPACRGTRPMSA